MKWLRVASIAIGLLALVGLLARLLSTAARTETGFETLEEHWRRATIGWALGDEPVASRAPPDQARYWLPEAERIVSDHPNDAQVAMGAAMVLDRPAIRWSAIYYLLARTFGEPLWDVPRATADYKSFESQTASRSLGFADRAVHIEPRNVAWHRCRAFLYWRRPPRSPTPDERWREIVAECAEHDPDNALYDYLSALWYWESSAELSGRRSAQVLTINDASRFELGVAALARGQSKRLAFIDPSDAAAAAFLRHSDLTRLEQMDVIDNRALRHRFQKLLFRLLEWQQSRIDAEIRASDFGRALALHDQMLRLCEQGETNPTGNLSIVLAMHRMEATNVLGELTRAHKALSATEQRHLGEQYRRAQLDVWVVREMEIRLTKASGNDVMTQMRRDRWREASFAVCIPLPRCIAATLLLGLAAFALSRFAPGQRLESVGGRWLAGLLAVSFAVAAAICALAPAEVISPTVQAWVFTLLLTLPAPLLCVGMVYRWLRRRPVRLSLRSILFGVFVFGAIFGVVAMTKPRSESFTSVPFDLSIPGRISPLLMGIPRKGWLGALEQWSEYRGWRATIVLWLGLSTVALVRKLRRASLTKNEASIPVRDFARPWLRMAGGSLVALSVILLAAYLALAPQVVRAIDEQYQRDVASIGWPDAEALREQSILRAIRADKALMRRFEKIVDDELASEAADATME